MKYSKYSKLIVKLSFNAMNQADRIDRIVIAINLYQTTQPSKNILGECVSRECLSPTPSFSSKKKKIQGVIQFK